jgi:hypothetical protein
MTHFMDQGTQNLHIGAALKRIRVQRQFRPSSTVAVISPNKL